MALHPDIFSLLLPSPHLLFPLVSKHDFRYIHRSIAEGIFGLLSHPKRRHFFFLSLFFPCSRCTRIATVTVIIICHRSKLHDDCGRRQCTISTDDQPRFLESPMLSGSILNGDLLNAMLLHVTRRYQLRYHQLRP